MHYGCSQIFFPGREEVHSLIHAHVQYVIYIFPTVSHLQDFRLEPLSATSLADHLHVRHKLHGDSYKSLSLTFGTTSAIRIEREIIGLIAIYLRILLLGKEFTDIIINLKICDSIGAGTSSDRILIDIFHPCDSIQIAFKTAENARLVSGLVQPPEHGGIEYVPTREDFPEPDTPVTTVSTPRGNFTSISLRLCSIAPFITMEYCQLRRVRV